MDESLNLPSHEKISGMVSPLFTSENYVSQKKLEQNGLSESSLQQIAPTVGLEDAKCSLSALNQSNSFANEMIHTERKEFNASIKPLVTMSGDTIMKIDLAAVNELNDGKKGAVKRKARPPRPSFDEPKKNCGKKKKSKTTVITTEEITNPLETQPTAETTLKPVSAESPTQKPKPKTKSKPSSNKSNTPKKPPNLKCMTCDKELSNEQNLMKHLLTHNNNHTCMVCMKTFKSTHFLRHHMDKHNDGYNYSCEICHKKFKFRNNMLGHMKKHNMTKKFECEVCHKKFIGKYNLKEHMKAHSDERPFECNFCDKAYKDRGALNKHLLTHQEKKVECGICQRQFSSEKQVQRHMQFHYSWPGDSFKRKSNIDGNGEKIRYQCEYCDKTFNHYSNMNAHVHKKHKEKKIKCTECPKTFAYQYELREHMFIHKGAVSSKFKCQVCDKSFQRSTTLKNHERTTHLGIKRFKCEICGKMFGTKFNMKVHVEKLHNENSSNDQKPKRTRNNVHKNIQPPIQDGALIVQLPPPPTATVEHHMLPQLSVSLPPTHQHPLLRNINTNDIIRNAIAHIPELGYFPPLQPHPGRAYPPFFGIPPTDFGVSQ